MFRKLGVAGLVAGAALGMALGASPAQAVDHAPILVNYQAQDQAANSESNSVAFNCNDIENNSEAEAEATGLDVEVGGEENNFAEEAETEEAEAEEASACDFGDDNDEEEEGGDTEEEDND